jgi:hypothetical protein
MTYAAAQHLQSLRRRVDFFSEPKLLKAKAGRGREIMKTNLRAMNVVLAMAAAMISAAITIWLAGEASWLKFAAWTIVFGSLQGWLFLPQNAVGRWRALKLPRLWKRG